MKLFKYLSGVAALTLAATTFAAGETVFNKDLYFGLRGNKDVTALQTYLLEKGFYGGPVTGNFYTLTRAGVINFQKANYITPAVGYFGPISRRVANKLIADEAVQKAAAVAPQPASPATPTPAVAPIEPPKVVTPTLPNPFESSLKIEFTYPNTTISRYTDVTLTEFKLTDDAPSPYAGTDKEHGANEEIALKKIRLKNTATLDDRNIVQLKLLNSRTGAVLANGNIVPKDTYFEFTLTPDDSKPNKGLMVSGGLYSVTASIITPNTYLKPKVRLDIMDATDITAVDYRDINRVANVGKMNTFPIVGALITLP